MLLDVVRTDLKEYMMSIKGTMRNPILVEEFTDALIQNKVPERWRKVSFKWTSTLTNWFATLMQNLDMIQKMTANPAQPSWLMSTFFFPQGFITAVLQVHSRKHKFALDELGYVCRMTSKDYREVSQPTQGVYIHGFFLQCGLLEHIDDEMILMDQRPKEMLKFLPAPVLHLKPWLINEIRPSQPS